MNEALVSIIMPARNVAEYIEDAIHSVKNQTWSNWELLIIENDSSDGTGEIISRFKDPRILHIVTKESGLSNARNIGLKQSTGKFICFLDADDRLPPGSISDRIEIFLKSDDVSFVDGYIRTYDKTFQKQINFWKPDFEGNPHEEMGLLAPRCFCGVTWMIRREAIAKHLFDNSWTRLEDRLFFLSISENGKYKYTSSNTYDIRRRPQSLMTNHILLEKAYIRFLEKIQKRKILTSEVYRQQIILFHLLFFKTYLKDFLILKSLHHLYIFMNMKFFK